MQITLCAEDVSVFQRIYAEKPEAVDWMLKFGSPIEKVIAEIIKTANGGKTRTLSLNDTNISITMKRI